MSQAAEEVQLTKGLFARARALRRCAVQLAAQECSKDGPQKSMIQAISQMLECIVADGSEPHRRENNRKPLPRKASSEAAQASNTKTAKRA